MAKDKKIPELDKGFEEVPLDEGFQEVPVALSGEDKDAVSKYISQPEVPLTESLRAGYANGGTFGFAPRIGAAGGALASKAQQALDKDPKPQSMQELYNEYLKYNNDRQAKAAAGNPITYGAGQLAGGIVSPMNKIGAVGELGAEAPMIAKMAQGAKAGARMGTVAGLSQSNDLGDVKQDVERAGEGMAMGGGLGAVTPPIGAGLKAAAGGAANFVRPLIGKPGQMFGKGMQAGVEGAPNLAGEPGQLQAIQDRGQFADQFVNDLHDVLSSNAKNKRELIANALKKSQLAPKEAVQAVFQKYLTANPQLNEESARKELAHLKDMIITAAEGPEKQITVREYAPGMEPKPAPMNAQAPPPPEPQGLPPGPQAPPEPPPLNPEVLPPEVGGVPGAPKPPMQGEPTPNDFSGYKKVMAQTVDKNDKEAMEAFRHKIKVKEAEERALPGQADQQPIEVVAEPVEGYPDKMHLVARRPIVQEAGDEFADQAKNLAANQKAELALQKQKDKVSAAVAKANMDAQDELSKQQAAGLAKPFQDVQQTVREGGRNIQDPQELYNLQKNLQSKSQFSEGRGFSSQEMNKMSGDAAKDIAQLIKMTIPETVPVDERLNAFNNVAERLGINTDNLKLPGGEGQKARADAMKKVLGVLSPESPTDKSQMNQNTIDYLKQQLGRVHPDIADAFEKEAGKHAENAGTIADLTKPETVGGGGPILSSIRRGLNKTAYSVGHGIGSEVKKTAPLVNAGKAMFQNYTPDVLQKAGAAASQSTNEAVQKMGQVLTKLATADDRTRNSMMFVLEQQAGYRQMMSQYFPKEEQGTPQAKDKSLEKYK